MTPYPQPVKKILIISLLGMVLLVGSFGCSRAVLAQERSYYYQNIDIRAQVNQDTTVDVVEWQTFNYQGEYHQGWRSIPLQKISAITDIQVLDGQTGQPLKYSTRRLDKINPASWGYYTVFSNNGAKNIEWYYNLSNTTHQWVIKYKVHGALSFLASRDEFYWNLFTDYEVPIKRASLTVSVPDNQFALNELKVTGYGAPISPASTAVIDHRTFYLSAGDLPAYEQLTIAASWPQGLVDRQAFWRDWFFLNWSYLLSGLIIVGTIVYAFGHWYFLEYRPEHSRVVVPEYSPPSNLKPAMAQVIVKEGIDERAWTATIVDLAVRGYLKIEEVKPPQLIKITNRISPKSIVLIFYLISVLLAFISAFSVFFVEIVLRPSFFLTLLITFFVVLILLSLRIEYRRNDFQLTKVKSLRTDDTKEYEQTLIWTIFGRSESISLTELKRQNRNSFGPVLLQAQNDLYDEVGKVAPIYDVPLVKSSDPLKAIGVGGILLAVFMFDYYFLASFLKTQQLIFFSVVGICLSIIWWFACRDPRLSSKGMELKRQWLGFILYLKTAERYRLQNLTPTCFEKYLPYAIAFGIEDKWAKAFAGLALPAPSWYTAFSSGSAAGLGGGAFSASFASSFASTFASSSGGASGGAGGSGGGGGGGGGGAS